MSEVNPFLDQYQKLTRIDAATEVPVVLASIPGMCLSTYFIVGHFTSSIEASAIIASFLFLVSYYLLEAPVARDIYLLANYTVGAIFAFFIGSYPLWTIILFVNIFVPSVVLRIIHYIWDRREQEQREQMYKEKYSAK